ncbi:alkaline phosphatase family protein [Psychroflexus sp. YR1-1]|uniref:Alkaline phosphatase family protein n=1 Tax=Psychroflexus aurantiacus TaxID=2709310 RepID=A0A6B3R163_9FLAO|nr:alkaline phosphatase D family protein [Psychroflexus aurantiacus]NEV93140.1 alkaline phosphatase family protein [Psychroflexus aurantiacus]
MNTRFLVLVLASVMLGSCRPNTEQPADAEQITSFRIALGSCNRQDMPQDYWSVIQKDSADIFIWGGDNIYADTPDMDLMEAKYDSLKNNPYYQTFVSKLPYGPMGVWDDHDYGKNDAGEGWEYKDEAKTLFMDFMDIDSTHAMANRGGIYHAEVIDAGDKSIKFYMLDMRYFRDGLLEAEASDKRYQPHSSQDSTLLGEAQWDWLEQEFKKSEADFNIIVSSIQFLSSEHGFETWGNFPHEVEKLQSLLLDYSLDNVLMLSGDRHISEFSQKKIEGLDYMLTDFTSSGLTHSYASYDGEPNQYRVGEVVAQTSYGIVDLDLEVEEADLKIKSTKDGHVIQNLKLSFSK